MSDTGTPIPPLPNGVQIRNASIRRLHIAIGWLYALNPDNTAAALLWQSWCEFLQSPGYRLLPDAQLYPVYKAFSKAYHFAWQHAALKPSLTPDVGIVTLYAEDLLENMDDFERALGKTLDGALSVVTDVTGALLLPAAAVIAILLLLRK